MREITSVLKETHKQEPHSDAADDSVNTPVNIYFRVQVLFNVYRIVCTVVF